jgi:hypothetical protein
VFTFSISFSASIITSMTFRISFDCYEEEDRILDVDRLFYSVNLVRNLLTRWIDWGSRTELTEVQVIPKMKGQGRLRRNCRVVLVGWKELLALTLNSTDLQPKRKMRGRRLGGCSFRKAL